MKALGAVITGQFASRVVPLFLVVTPFLAIGSAQAVTLGEAVDNTGLAWTTGGDADWFGQSSHHYYDGDAAQSGDISSGQSSWIQTTVTGPGILSFYWKVSSVFARLDLEFYIDGVRESWCWAYENWEPEAHSIPSGSHTLRWDYAPLSEGDAGFLDRVVFSAEPVIIVESPNGGETWQHRTFHTIQWLSHEGAGPSVKIELYKGGSFSRTISAGTGNDGSYEWFVPAAATPGTDYRIKITSTSSSSVYDHSDGDFSTAEWFQSSFGGALILDGVDDYAESEDDPELDVGDEPGEDLTIEAWVNFQSWSGNIIEKPDAYWLYPMYDSPNEASCICFFLWSTPDQYCGYCQCQRPRWSYGWHHVAGVFRRETAEMSLYLDGELISGPDYVTTISNSSESLEVGTLTGAVDEVRISDVARYSGSSFTLPTSPYTCDEHTRALYHFDEFEGATIFHDACGTMDNLLIAHNGAHAEGVPAHQVYLPLIIE
jgi:hypothetical protein